MATCPCGHDGDFHAPGPDVCHAIGCTCGTSAFRAAVDAAVDEKISRFTAWAKDHRLPGPPIQVVPTPDMLGFPWRIVIKGKPLQLNSVADVPGFGPTGWYHRDRDTRGPGPWDFRLRPFTLADALATEAPT